MLAILLASTAVAYAEDPDPRNLFKDGRYDAAAAGFEARFDREKQALDDAAEMLDKANNAADLPRDPEPPAP